jgi:hypothetical protein
VLGLIGAFGTALVAQPAGAATTLFVSETGSDSNPCAVTVPCATITHALSVAGSGATIEVAGTIHDAVSVSTTATIEQWPGHPPAVIDATGRGTSVVTHTSTGNLLLDGLTVTGGSGSEGAGIANDSGSLTISNSTITGNTATGVAVSGGGIFNLGALTITGSTISDNTAVRTNAVGGGILNGGTAIITGTTITGNSVVGRFNAFGGGIMNTGSANISGSTITDNSVTGNAFGFGGGIFNGDTVTIGATIVAGNMATVTAANNCEDTLTSFGYNLTDDATGMACGFAQATDKVNVNPDLGPLANNGGTTETMLPALTSPAVGVIPSPTTLNGVLVCGAGAFDQRGVPRPTPGPNCSIGAVEAFAPSLSGGASMTALPNGTGYWIVHPDGGVFSFGSAPFLGSLPGLGIHVNNIVGITVTPDGKGYWLIGSDGGVFSFGDATFFGSMGGKPLNKPMVAMAASPNGAGYWLVAADGGVFTFGHIDFFGSMGGKPLNAPMVDMAADPAGGYWLVASDGGLFTFGGAPFFGSMGGKPLNKPVVGVTSAPGGIGYWLVASDGGVFTFGRVRFAGSLGGSSLSIVGLFSTNGGNDYTLVEANGTAHPF